MRLVRFERGAAGAYGLVEGDALQPLAGAPWSTGGVAKAEGDSLDRRTARLLVPAEPTKILGVGRNYRAHAKELGNEVPAEPLIFYKPPSSLLPHHGVVVLPKDAGRVDFEGELALVVGARARNVPKERWRDVVFGLTCALDITARELQKKDGQWWRAKGADGFCPVGPAVEAGVDPADLHIETRVDGVVKQSARTSDMLFDVGTLVAHITRWLTLEPGDLILTGTPEGVGPLAAGQTVELEIEKVGCLSVRIEAE